MFIDENGNLQFSSIEELKENKDLAVAELDKWVVPSIEEIELIIVNAVNTSIIQLQEAEVLDVLGETPEEIINTMMYTMKMGMEMAADIIENDIGIDVMTLKFNDYVNRFYIACDNVKNKVLL
jgi:hypothetical protein